MSSKQEAASPLISPVMGSSPLPGRRLSTSQILLNPNYVIVVTVFLLFVYALLVYRSDLPVGGVYEMSEQSNSFHRLPDKIINEGTKAKTAAEKLKPMLDVLVNSLAARRLSNKASGNMSTNLRADNKTGSSVISTSSGTSGSEKLLNTSEPVILLWTSLFSNDSIWIPDLKTQLHCPVHNCLITNNRIMLSQSSAVIFHLPNVVIRDLPVSKHKQEGQKWVLFNEESPEHSDTSKMKALAGLIDMTATYRKDSNLFAPYAVIERTNDTKWTLDNNVEEKIAGKKKMAAWIVSNCNTPSRRESYVMGLKRYLNVDIYGSCGPLKCLPKRSKECFRMMEKNYWFYLSFENSICKDYVTEKLFEPLKWNIVPVVMGGADYGSLMPGEVFYVDALNFSSPKHLAEFLNSLVKDKDLYKSYLMWKTRYRVKEVWLEWACDLCEMLQKDRMSASKSISKKLETKDESETKNLRQWWYGEGNCTNWSKILLT